MPAEAGIYRPARVAIKTTPPPLINRLSRAGGNLSAANRLSSLVQQVNTQQAAARTRPIAKIPASAGMTRG